MEPKRAGLGMGRVIAGTALGVALAGGCLAAYLILGGDDSGLDTGSATGTTVMSAEDGAAARAERQTFGPAGNAGVGTKVAADSSLAIDCPIDGEIYVPTEEEIASANADTEALAQTFVTYGIPYERIVDDQGFAYLTWDNNDIVAQSVSGSFWADRYPVQPPSQTELDQARTENDVIARHLDEAGKTYTRTTTIEGWESITYDYDDEAAAQAVTDAYNELYPPTPPLPEELAQMKADNDKLAAAFDEAGIAYSRKSDALGYEWIEWDYEDPAIQPKVDAIFLEIYPPTEGVGCLAATEGDPLADTAGGVDGPVNAEGSEGDPLEVDPAAELTPEQLARQDAEVTALVDGFAAAGVTYSQIGESPWQTVNFDVTNPASITVVADVLASRA